MIYIHPENNHVLDVSHSADARDLALRCGYECRHDWDTLERAQDAAERANSAPRFVDQHTVEESAPTYIAVDNGRGCSPRFDVVRAPQVGDPVSRAINGDYYPAGHIARVSPSLKVVTTTEGERFYRRRLTGTWARGSWALVQGHHDERNPHI